MISRERLNALSRVRRLALDAARTELAEALRQEEEAARRRHRIEAEIADERALASRLDADDTAVESFAAWLRLARGRAEAAGEAVEHAASETARARAAVTAAKVGFEATTTLQDAATAAEQDAETRREQERLEDAARGLRSLNDH